MARSDLNREVSVFGDWVAEKLKLTADQEELLQLIEKNRKIQEPANFTVMELKWKQEMESTTSIENTTLSLSPSAQASLAFAFITEGEPVVLRDFELPVADRSKEVFPVPAGKIVCAAELVGRLSLQAGAQWAAEGLSLGIEGEAGAEVQLSFFKTFPATTNGGRDLLLKTLQSFKSPLTLIENRLTAGEIAVLELDGRFRIDADMGYGFTVEGSRKFGRCLSDTALESGWRARARLGLRGSIEVHDRLHMVVRRSERGSKWVNVSFVKAQKHETSASVNLTVDAELKTTTHGGDKLAGAYVDGLLARTEIPTIMATVCNYDSSEEVCDALADQQGKAVKKVTEAIYKLVGRKIENFEEEYATLLDDVRTLVDHYNSFKPWAPEFFERAIDRCEQLAELDDAIDSIIEMGSADDLILWLSDHHGGEETGNLLEVLAVVQEILGDDLTQVAILNDKFGQIQELLKGYVEKREKLQIQVEGLYRRLERQLGVRIVMPKIKAWLSSPSTQSLQDLLNEGVAWLDEYLKGELGVARDMLVTELKPATEALKKLTAGYENLVTKAKNTLETSLNRELYMVAAVGWNQVKQNETLASIDLNLAKSAGRKGYLHLLRGDVAQVMNDRIKNANAIRFLKSDFLDQVLGGVSVRTVINGTERLSVSSYLVEKHGVLTPTETGEIWVSRTKLGSTYQRKNRKAILNVRTMLDFSVEQHLHLKGDHLVASAVDAKDYGLRYCFAETLSQQEYDAPTVVQRIDEARKQLSMKLINDLEFRSFRNRLDVVGKFGPLRKVSFRIETFVTSSALTKLFENTETGDFETSVLKGWDDAVGEVYADIPRVVPCYIANRGATPSATSHSITEWNVNRIEARALEHLLGTRGTFLDHLSAVREKAFRSPHADLAPVFFEGLAKKMKWILDIKMPGARDFIMTVFALLADQTERGQSIIVSYQHPLQEDASKPPMELRVDSLPPSKAGEVSRGASGLT